MSPRHVHVIGSGLLGTSVALGLRRLGVTVTLEDASPAAALLAEDLGAGTARRGDEPLATDSVPELIVVCVPPDVTAAVVARALREWPTAVVTDVASVKHPISTAISDEGTGLDEEARARYLGSHPMAGRETGGPLSARADLFVGRPWVLCPTPATDAASLILVRDLARDLGASPVELEPERHDEAVALISHAPQVVSTLLAARMLDDEHNAASLAGQGVRDVTRIAASDPALWVQILAGNGPRVARILRALGEDLDRVATALEAIDEPGARRTVAEQLRAGNDGVARLPGKHGTRRNFEQVTVLIDDEPGQLGRLFTDIGAARINLEDVRIDHAPGVLLGLVEMSIVPEAKSALIEALTAKGWRIAA